MSYDIYLVDPVTKQVLHADTPHRIAGGTYAIGGTNQMWLNVTYNYAPHFRGFGPEGIRELYGKSGAESIPLIEAVIAVLGDDKSDDYWEPTEGNAKTALYGLLALARMRPDGIWQGD